MKRVAFYTLGCKLNYSETSSISRLFEEKGYSKVDFKENPDVFVINTCSVTDNADKKCVKIVKEAKKISPNSFVVIIGCFAQLKPEYITSIPGVDAVLGASEKFRLIELLGDFEKKEEVQVFASEIDEVQDFHHSHSINDRTRTFLKVQDGCDYSCSFCTIPLARGKSRSASVNSILNEAKKIAETDVKEIVLTGVNIGDYGIIDGEKSSDFLSLIIELDKIDGIERFRISSIEPNLLTDEIIEFVAQSKKFVPHFHIPLQSGSDEMLKLMRRRYKRDVYESRVEKIKELMPDCCIGVDVIVGFKGETEERFTETLDFVKSLDVSYFHVFTYSERANTTALDISPNVPFNKRTERSKILRSLSEKKRRKFYESQLNKEDLTLFEQKEDNGLMTGFTSNYVKIEVPFDPELVNQIKKVKLNRVTENSNVEGELIV